MSNHDPRPPKDAWDKWAIVLSPVGGLLTAMAIAALSFLTSRSLGKWQDAQNKSQGEWQERETRSRLYTELMSRREQAETDLRKEMFKSASDAFFKSMSGSVAEGEAASLDQEVLKMELLAYNFHESFNLTPLFKDLGRRLEERIDAAVNSHDTSGVGKYQDCLSRLQKVADDIIIKQLAVLEDGTNYVVLDTVDLRAVPGGPSMTATFEATVEKTRRRITVEVTKIDEATQELRVSLHVKTLNGPPDAAPAEDNLPETVAEFWVGAFDFPMIDNTRLSRDQRCAVTVEFIKRESTTLANITVVCFPGSRATFKEKPYYDDVLEKLKPTDT